VLAVFGVGAAGSSATMRLIVPRITGVLAAVLALLAVTGWWSARRIGRACCPPDAGQRYDPPRS
jgi:hypothetical protein